MAVQLLRGLLWPCARQGLPRSLEGPTRAVDFREGTGILPNRDILVVSQNRPNQASSKRVIGYDDGHHGLHDRYGPRDDASVESALDQEWLFLQRLNVDGGLWNRYR